MKVTNQMPPGAGLVDSTRGAEKTKGAGPAAESGRKAAVEGSSQVSISENARLMSRAAEAARSAPDVRADRVEALKAQIAAGTYQIDSSAIAERLLEEHLNTDFGKNNL